ncbi:MAG: hypothetical protein AABX13_04495 [Nanoarchaeota archaeon]
MTKIGIIGGSGLYKIGELEEAGDVDVSTPYRETSFPLRIGKIMGIPVAFISRHGWEHTVPPTKVNSRANI